MTEKDLRREVLCIVYNSKYRYACELSELKDLILRSSEEEVDRAIRYLEGHNFLERKNLYMGEYLNFYHLAITSYGIDLVEDPESFNKLFSVNITTLSNINQSNVLLSSSNNTASIKISSDFPSELTETLESLVNAVTQKDEEKVVSIWRSLDEGAKTIFWNIVSQALISISQT